MESSSIGETTSRIGESCHRPGFIYRKKGRMKLGSKLNQLCKAQGWSLSRLAKEAGVPMQTVHAWTIGRKSINPDQIRKVAAVLKISIHELMFDEPDPNEPIGEEILREIFSGDVRVTLHRIERRRKRYEKG